MTCPNCKRPLQGQPCPKKRCQDAAKIEAVWREKYAAQMAAYYSGPVVRASGSRLAEQGGSTRRNGFHVGK